MVHTTNLVSCLAPVKSKSKVLQLMEQLSTQIDEAKILSFKIKSAATFFADPKTQQSSPHFRRKRPRQVAEDINKDCESIMSILDKIQASLEKNELISLSVPTTPVISSHQNMESFTPPPPSIKEGADEVGQEKPRPQLHWKGDLAVATEINDGLRPAPLSTVEIPGGTSDGTSQSAVNGTAGHRSRRSSSAGSGRRERDYSFWLQGEPEMDQIEYYVQCLQREIYQQDERLQMAQRCASKFLRLGQELDFSNLSSLLKVVGEAEAVQLQVALGSQHLEGMLNQLEYRRLLQRATEGSNRLSKLRAEARAVTQTAGMFSQAINELLKVCHQLETFLLQSGTKEHVYRFFEENVARQAISQIQHTALAYYVLLKEPHFVAALDATLKEIRTMNANLQEKQHLSHADLTSHLQGLMRTSVPFLQRIRQKYIKLRQRYEGFLLDNPRKGPLCPICLQNELGSVLHTNIRKDKTSKQILPSVQGNQCRSVEAKPDQETVKMATSRSLPTLPLQQGHVLVASPMQQINRNSKWRKQTNRPLDKHTKK